jgi:hypothetical protein
MYARGATDEQIVDPQSQLQSQAELSAQPPHAAREPTLQEIQFHTNRMLWLAAPPVPLCRGKGAKLEFHLGGEDRTQLEMKLTQVGSSTSCLGMLARSGLYQPGQLVMLPAALLLCCSAALLLCCSAALLLCCSAALLLCWSSSHGQLISLLNGPCGSFRCCFWSLGVAFF